MWQLLRLIGHDNWLETSIVAGTCVAVTDGSYIRELYPHLCAVAFIIECSEGNGLIVGSFPEKSSAASAYRGELLGLLAIHLILLAANKVQQDLRGLVRNYSNCLGALTKVATFPRNRIPTRCRHSDIQKTIMVHCQDLTFDCSYLHVRAHQDDNVSYDKLVWPAQLNCLCDRDAKGVIWGLEGEELPPQEVLPLESVAVFIGGEKMTSDTGDILRYWAQRQIAKEYYYAKNVLNNDQFEEVAWQVN